MAKSNFKNNIKQGPLSGMDNLIRPTTVEAAGSSERKITGDKEKAVHCNFVMDARYHKQLKIIATKRGVALKIILEEAISAYCEKNKDLL